MSSLALNAEVLNVYAEITILIFFSIYRIIVSNSNSEWEKHRIKAELKGSVVADIFCQYVPAICVACCQFSGS